MKPTQLLLKLLILFSTTLIGVNSFSFQVNQDSNSSELSSYQLELLNELESTGFDVTTFFEPDFAKPQDGNKSSIRCQKRCKFKRNFNQCMRSCLGQKRY